MLLRRIPWSGYMYTDKDEPTRNQIPQRPERSSKMPGTMTHEKIDAVKAAPDLYKVLLDNSKVRVLELRVKPGEKVQMHSHPSMAIYAFNDARNRFTFPDGKTQDIELKAGETRWMDPFSHAAENIGKSETHLLLIELC